MTNNQQTGELLTTISSGPSLAGGAHISRNLLLLARAVPQACGWELHLPDSSVVPFGSGPAAFRIHANTRQGLAAMESLDEFQIARCYLNGELNLEGDIRAALSLRAGLIDRHPLLRFWSQRVQPLLRGQTACDRKWIESHYDEAPEFYELFLDRRYRCYSQGLFAEPWESLESAIERKLQVALEATRLAPGSRVLDIGAGWGSFVEFAGRLGIHVTSLTISRVSERYVSDLIARLGLPCRVLCEHLMEHRTAAPYDAIVNLGVTEHLPDYPATIRQYERLLKPGGRIYLDASAARAPQSTSTATLIYPGNGKFMDLAEYVRAVQDSAFDILSLENDTDDYERTMECWARNLDAARAEAVERFGERQYRRFRLYLWAGAHALSIRDLEAYHLVLRKRS